MRGATYIFREGIRKHLRRALWLIPLAGLVAFGTVSGQSAAFQPVTDDVLQNPSDSDWLQWRRTYDGWAYSPLDQITTDNVGDLQLAWVWSMTEGSNQPTPLVHDGIMYLTNPGNIIQALDAGTAGNEQGQGGHLDG